MKPSPTVVLLAAMLFFCDAVPTPADGPYRPTFEERVAAQRAIEAVYWSHRIWPEQNPEAKPGIDRVLGAAALRAKVEDTLAKSSALETLFDRPISADQLQAELNRMARSTQRPEVLEQLFAALNHDATLIAECLVRPRLADRLLREAHAQAAASTTESFDDWWGQVALQLEPTTVPIAAYSLPALAGSCTDDSWTLTSARAPAARNGHTAVWTGSELIVWGGQDLTGFLGSGGRYDPATDTWTETSTAPFGGRTGHTAIWTGTEMIVWGGQDQTGYLFSGGRYDPSTDRWTSTLVGSGTPNRRVSHTAVWSGTEMIVWGGTLGSPVSHINDGGRYDPATDTWVYVGTSGAPTGRVGHVAVWTGTEMIVWGGEQLNFPSSPIWPTSGGRFDPTSGTWTATSTGVNVPPGASQLSAVWSGSEMIVWGGLAGSTYRNTGGRYDPTTNSWQATSTAAGVPGGRRSHLAVWTGAEMIVWGGDSSSGFHDTGGRYDPATDSWTATGTGAGLPSARTQPEGAWTGSEMIVWGGIRTGNQVTDTGGRYDPTADGWTPTGTGAGAPTGRSSHVAVWTGAEMIVWGGNDGAGGGHTGGRYDPATDSWQATSVAGVPTARSNATAVWTGTEMIVWGGYGGGDLDTGGRYDPVGDTWTSTSTGPGTPVGRTLHTAIWTGKEMIVWGGSSVGPVVHATGGKYDPASDTWAPTGVGAGVPSARNQHSAVWTGKEMIVWGGIDTGFSGTGGRYDPIADAWTATSTGAGAPAARSSHTAVWTGSRMVVWGGTVSGPTQTDTGARYDPIADTWTTTSTGGGAAAPRSAHTAVWSRNEMIVWGGFAGTPLGTGGRYDPQADGWAATSTGANAPFARFGHTAVWSDDSMIVWGSQGLSAAGSRYCACSSAAPSTVPDLQVTRPSAGSTTARLTWLAVTDATGYDVVRGTLSTLRANSGDFSASTETCLTNNQATTTFDDAVAVSAGNGVWYLLRGVSCGGLGSYDSDGLEQAADRDAAVAASGVSCP